MSISSTVSYQVMWNRMISVVEEQAQALIRASFSTSVREAGDLSAGIYNQAGKMMAQAVTGTPGHVNAMADSVGHFITNIGLENIFESDVYITNDPWKGTGHLHDITVVTPLFYQGKHVGFFACTAHVTDIGGRGFGADANSIYEEGLFIPIMKIIDQGKVDETLLSIIRSNAREPSQLVGDIFSLIACNEVGYRRLQETMDEFKIADLEGLADFIFDCSRGGTLECIAALPRSSAEGSLILDGYDTPIHLRVKLEIQADKIICDFAGTSPLDKKGINVPLVYTKAYACYALKCAVAAEIPNNAASLAPFIIQAPKNSIVHAEHPAPVALRHVIGHMIPDTVYNALDKILPHRIPAEGAGTLCNFQISIQPRTDQTAPEKALRSEVLCFNSGGSGARPTLDGLNATAFPSGVMTMPIEVTEHSGPIIIWRKELWQDSGGAGKYRGGLGQCMEVGVTEGHEFYFQAMLDRLFHPARGKQGGKNGAPTKIYRGDGEKMQGKGKQFVPHGQKVMLFFPGGAGYGKTKDRRQESIYYDLIGGYISRENARKEYGLSEHEISKILNVIERREEEI